MQSNYEGEIAFPDKTYSLRLVNTTKRKKAMKLNKTQIFLIALVIGLIGGNALTIVATTYHNKSATKLTDDELFILYETQTKNNEDSIKYNNRIAEISAQYYQLELENRELKEKLATNKASTP